MSCVVVGSFEGNLFLTGGASVGPDRSRSGMGDTIWALLPWKMPQRSLGLTYPKDQCGRRRGIWLYAMELRRIGSCPLSGAGWAGARWARSGFAGKPERKFAETW